MFRSWRCLVIIYLPISKTGFCRIFLCNTRTDGFVKPFLILYSTNIPKKQILIKARLSLCFSRMLLAVLCPLSRNCTGKYPYIVQKRYRVDRNGRKRFITNRWRFSQFPWDGITGHCRFNFARLTKTRPPLPEIAFACSRPAFLFFQFRSD